ncbi:MAG: ATP-dependent exonuclease SbcCD, C subunit-like protein [Synergistaceae bacterium]|jgi:uncharacterized protein YPO0396|nr:ATP-dependent exonuclease SbcCD, C subunit-like protein [Synergistaceae bacterium]
MPTQNELDFASEDVDASEAGFRLHRFEVLNWGTFDNRVWSLELGGKNGLLTGDIGSGKSTLMDGVTTLLVPPNRASYNKAAGADRRERTLRSYVEGHYKSERLENYSTAKPVALRGPENYTALLGFFHNAASGQSATLAQVFWRKKEDVAQIERFFVVSDRELTIASHFANFGVEMKNLRKRLESGGAEILDSFTKYRARFSRALGIPPERSEHALNLFHQAVSMKSIGDLTDFVRAHMLEPFDVSDRINSLIGHFDDLTRAHESILKAKRQIELLTPLVGNCSAYERIMSEAEALDLCLAANETYFAGHRSELLTKRIGELAEEENGLEEAVRTLGAQKDDNERRIDELKTAIRENGGDRVESIKLQITQKTKERDERRQNFDRYSHYAASLGFQASCDRDGFASVKKGVESIYSGLDDKIASNQNAVSEKKYELKSFSDELDELRGELKNLRAHRTNIGSKHIALREKIASELGIRAENIPFAGELLAVRPEDSAWEGAAERILHNFALSVLVPDEHYMAVSDWIDRNHIGGRMVYYRVRSGEAKKSPADFPRVVQNSLSAKLEVKAGSRFEDWLCAELASRFNYVCCDDMDSFRREKKAVTKTGQIKADDRRHEKDDRYRIDDRSRYVLGWDNRSKIDVLENSERVAEARRAKASAEVDSLSKEYKTLKARNDDVVAIMTYQDFNYVNWQGTAVEIEELKSEHDRLVEASDKLRQLNKNLRETEQNGKVIEKEIAQKHREIGNVQNRKLEDAKQLAVSNALRTEEAVKRHAPYFGQLDEYAASIYEDKPTLDNCGAREREISARLTKAKNSQKAHADEIAASTIKMMFSFHLEYPLETREFDSTMSSAPDYRGLFERLESDDLPRFEAKFKELLNENTIREIAAFQATLHMESQSIQDRINTINESLADIDYNQGRFIKLMAHRANDSRIRDFQNELKSCTEGSMSGSADDAYSEDKFQNVVNLIEKLACRPEYSESDAKWAELVTDVRNWFTFSVSEIWKETGEEYEHYTDSGGKSGGQKEKLAYTILAASLAYQFGLADESSGHRTFRFVMIDEAFGRGSDESAQFALSLFGKLSLQLLVATPLQKTHVIEPFISHVAFVRNEGGMNSRISNMTIEQYLERKNAARAVDDR